MATREATRQEEGVETQGQAQAGPYPTDLVKLCRVRQKMLNLLSDGADHTREELHGCLMDDMGPLYNIHPQLYLLRKEIRPVGLMIYTRKVDNVYYYRLRRRTAGYDGS